MSNKSSSPVCGNVSTTTALNAWTDIVMNAKRAVSAAASRVRAETLRSCSVGAMFNGVMGDEAVAARQAAKDDMTKAVDAWKEAELALDQAQERAYESAGVWLD
jgi:hypothetical protein